MPACTTDAVPAGPSIPITCVLAASSWLSAPASSLSALRAQVANTYRETLTSGTIKQCGEQGLLALLAVHQALHDAGMRAEDCRSWALVAAPRAIGRQRVAEALAKFKEAGSWSVSPHLIPNTSLHSLAGVLSQALRQNGPNIGAGGLLGTEGEALWAAFPLLSSGDWPGAWVIFSGWETESLDRKDVRCQAVVLGLQAQSARPELPQLTFHPSASMGQGVRFSLESLAASIRDRCDISWNVDGAVCSLSFAAVAREAAA